MISPSFHVKCFAHMIINIQLANVKYFYGVVIKQYTLSAELCCHMQFIDIFYH
jgi:hypothetical protein